MINYLLFITFFPQLIVGPIIHHAEVVPQFEDEKNLKLNPEHVAAGLFLFSIGLCEEDSSGGPADDGCPGIFRKHYGRTANDRFVVSFDRVYGVVLFLIFPVMRIWRSAWV